MNSDASLLTWIGILICILASALFSGMTIGLFGLTRLRLEVQAEAKNPNAIRILRLRKDSNWLLATLLWGNVGVNVLLTLLTESILTGAGAFIFSTVCITLFGEIMPQAYFSRHAMRVGAFFSPVIHVVRWMLFPVAKPTGLLLDLWLGKEGNQFFLEQEFIIMLKKHAQSGLTELGPIESIGAANFLALDDIRIEDEGERVDPASIVNLPERDGAPVFPAFRPDWDDPFVRTVHASRKKWVILTCPADRPLLVMNAYRFLADVLYRKPALNPFDYCHRPILITAPNTKLGQIIPQFHVHAQHREDDVVDHDIILYWGDEKRIITGADILGRLLRGIAERRDQADPARPAGGEPGPPRA